MLPQTPHLKEHMLFGEPRKLLQARRPCAAKRQTEGCSRVVVVWHNKNPPTPCLWQAPATPPAPRTRYEPGRDPGLRGYTWGGARIRKFPNPGGTELYSQSSKSQLTIVQTGLGQRGLPGSSPKNAAALLYNPAYVALAIVRKTPAATYPSPPVALLAPLAPSRLLSLRSAVQIQEPAWAPGRRSPPT